MPPEVFIKRMSRAPNVCIPRSALFWVLAGLAILASWAFAYGRTLNASALKNSSQSDEIHCHKVTVRRSPIHGRGVFAARDIRQGEVIEAAPIVTDSRDHTSSKMMDYVMAMSDDVVAYGFGYFTFYNDSQDPDAYFEIDKERDLVRVVASRDIPAGKEIFMSYGDKYWSTRDMQKV